jgi:hypothetical protein
MHGLSYFCTVLMLLSQFHRRCLALIMVASLSICTQEEQRSVTRFLWSEGVSGASVHYRLSTQYENSVLLQQSVYEWKEQLKYGHTSVTHEEVARCPLTVTNEDNAESASVRQMSDYWWSGKLCSHDSTYEIIHNRLGFHKVCARWVTKQLTMLHACQHLDCYGNGCDAFLDRIIAGEETWIH